VLDRERQLGTVQVDYNLPARFDLKYVGADNQSHRPVMVHRAPFGSLERFCGVLIEHFGGAFPAWLAPEQARVMPISEGQFEYAESVSRKLREVGLRVGNDRSPDKIGAKIRRAQMSKVPYMLVVGGREAEAGKVALRLRAGGDLGAMPVEEAVARIADRVRTRSLEL
jgi:threonyl-tRNA synthetase